MITLPRNVYKRDLLHWVYSLNVDECDKKEWELLKNVCTCYLYNGDHKFQIDRILFSEEDKQIIEDRDYIHADDIEIRARFIDVAIRCGLYKNKKLELKRQCSDLYLTIAENFHDCYAFIRTLLVRDVPALWDTDFINRLLKVIKKEDFNPRVLITVKDRILKNLGKDSEALTFILDIYSQRAKNEKKNDYQWLELYVDFLLAYNQLNRDTFHLKKALINEEEGDSLIHESEPDTFNTNIHEIYQSAFNEIDKVKELHPTEWNRIHEKLVRAKKDFVEILSFAGVHFKYEVSETFKQKVKEFLAPKMNFDNSMDVLLLLLDAPCYAAINDLVEKKRQEWSVKNPFLASCFNMAQLNDDGNNVGISNDDAGFNVQVHNYYRMHSLYYLWTIVEHFKSLQLKIDEDKVWNLLYYKKSSFVGEEQLTLWEKGICSIINGEPLLGSYILMPQVECIIRKIAEKKIGDMTKLSSKLQFEKMLGDILNELKPSMTDALYFELKFFLVDGCGVNLRNKMMHGLISNPMEVYKYSVYLLYFALNLFFREDRFLFNKE